MRVEDWSDWGRFQGWVRRWESDPRNHNSLFDRWAAIVGRHVGDLHGMPWIRRNRRYLRVVPRITAEFAYAVPTREALESVASHSPLVEVGAGTGYWAYLLERAGADVVCYDERAGGGGGGGSTGSAVGRFHPVLEGGPRELRRHPERNLFLCWPPHDTPLARDCLAEFGGRCVLYVGEWRGGACANDAFFSLLEARFELSAEVTIPSWWGYHDQLWVFHRAGVIAE
ncbi:MAG: hypothetical protein ACTSU5_05325 [Promethearchaeota archaeon]